jgi:type I site-specific restriction endonuclease
LILQERLWILLVESKQTSFSVEVALPQAIAYTVANSQPEQVAFGLVSNGASSIFVKLDRAQYGFLDEFSLNRRQNELYEVLKVLNRLKTFL